MNWSDDLKSLLLDLIANNRTTATGAAASASVAFGAVGLLEIINKALAFGAMAAGIYCTMALARYHRANARNMALKNLQMKKDLQDAGIDTSVTEE